MRLFNSAAMFNKRAAEPKFKANEVVRALELKSGDVVADIGSGGGYFAMLLAEAVGESGKVLAVDYNQEFLSYVEKTAKERGITNIKAVHVGKTTIELPERCDLVFMRNVYHHVAQPLEYMGAIRKYLKPGGRIAILDYKRTEKWSHTTLFGHYVDEVQLIAVMERAGYRLASSHDLLSGQSFNVFEIADQQAETPA